MRVPKAIERLIDSFERLPGIGPKTAQRLTFYLLQVPEFELKSLSDAVLNLKLGTKICPVCRNIGEDEKCVICSDASRDQGVICVVERALDTLALEKVGSFRGLYHVLGGALNPLENIGPDELFISDLLKRLENGKVSEVVIATNPTMEGEATAMYLKRVIKESGVLNGSSLAITRIGHGLPIGADLEYADERTLGKALEGRREY